MNFYITFSADAAGMKRKAQFSELFTPPLGKKAKKSSTSGGPQPPKNACVALNEYKPGLEYVLVEQRGSVTYRTVPTYLLTFDLVVNTICLTHS